MDSKSNNCSDLITMAGTRRITAGILSTSPQKPKETICLCSCYYCNSIISIGKHIKKPSEATINELVRRFPKTKFSWKLTDFSWLLLQISYMEFDHNFPLRIPEAMLWKKGMPEIILKPLGSKLERITRENMTKDFARTHFLNTDSKRGGDLSKTNRSPWKRTTNPIPEDENLKVQKIKTEPLSNLSLSPKMQMQTVITYKAVLKLKNSLIEGDENEFENMSPLDCLYLSEKALSEVFTSWTLDKLKSIISIHSMIKPRTEFDIIRVHYFNKRPCGVREKNKYELQKLSPHAATCLEITNEICRQISENTNYVILEMIVEYAVCDNSEIWLYDAWKIVYHNNKEEKLRLQKLEEIRHVQLCQRIKNAQLGRIKESEYRLLGPKASYLTELGQSVQKTFESIKEVSGAYYKPETDAILSQSNEAFSKLRPKSRVDFQTYIANKFNKLSNKLMPKGIFHYLI